MVDIVMKPVNDTSSMGRDVKEGRDISLKRLQYL